MENKLLGYHAQNEKEANHICKALHSQGKKWRDGTSYLKDNHYRFFKDQTVYTNYGTHVTLQWCEGKNIEVLPYYDCEYMVKSHRTNYSYWHIIIALIALLCLFLFTSCEKELDCNCEVFKYEKSVDYPRFTQIPKGVMDTVWFSEPKEVEYYSDNCNDQNTILRSDYKEVGLPGRLRVFYFKDIVKCK